MREKISLLSTTSVVCHLLKMHISFVLFVSLEGIIDSKNNLRTKLLLLLSKVKVHTYSLITTLLVTILFPVLTRFSLSGHSISAGDLYVILCIMGWIGVND